MSDQFPAFAALVQKQFQAIMVKERAFTAALGGDLLYEGYLAAFPEGTNPIFKTKTEHDCSCCKGFIRRVGGVVSIENGKVSTVWDLAAKRAAPPYNTVAEALRQMVLDSGVDDLFCVAKKETQFGAQISHSMSKDLRALTWNHLYTGPIPEARRSLTPDAVRGNYRTTAQVFERGLKELEPSAIETVLALIDANNLYRGEEHKAAVVAFKAAQDAYRSLASAEARALFVFENANGPASRFRNTVIGTLVQDLSEGDEGGLEKAVASFESKVAPSNYKRTSAPITPAMIRKAMETIQELGLEPALERRFARIEDVSVNDVKWVDAQTKPLMKAGLEGLLLAAVKPARTAPPTDGVAQIGLDAFMQDVLPTATELELFLKGQHLGNLVSLTAPVHPEPKQLFKWTNDFAWSYSGNVADSIRERVKRAGGKVEGAAMRASLSWSNFDDLDLHVTEPGGGAIYFGARRGYTGGTLDVDMNAGGGRSKNPVENIVWENAPTRDGVYRVRVNQYAAREKTDVGFVVEVEFGGKLMHFHYASAVRQSATIEVCDLAVRNGVVESVKVIDPTIRTENVAQTKWGVSTEQFVKVNAVTLSPNFWGNDAVGNKHTFFVLDGCKSDEPMRGVYNEFLHPRLEQHRKVFELIGSKTLCQPTEGQLSGVGFSSTKPDSFLVRVGTGKRKQVYEVKVGGESTRNKEKVNEQGQHV